MTVRISRDVVDAGLSFALEAPEDWLEYPNDQALLTLAGDLGQPEGTLRPSVQWSVFAAEAGAEETFAAIRRSLLELPEATVIIEEAGATPAPFYAIAMAFRNPSSGAAQVTLAFAQYFRGEVPVVVQTLGNCGGAAGAEVTNALAKIVRSTAVTVPGSE